LISGDLDLTLWVNRNQLFFLAHVEP
jgi:hypothetical protein